MTNLIISIEGERKEVEVSDELLSDLSLLLTNLEERDIAIPENPALTQTEGKVWTLHETPDFA